MITLGEAVHCEHDKAYGYEGSTHKVGNQTGDELRTTNFYIRPWKYCFRPKDKNVANAMAIRMRQAVNNKNCGYGQPQRETGHKALMRDPDPSHIVSPVDFDCSSLVNTIAKVTWEGIGHHPKITGLERTADMYGTYSKLTDYFENVTSKVNLKTGYGMEVGDIIWYPSSHTAMVVAKTSTMNKKPIYVAQCVKKCYVYKNATGSTKLAEWHQLEPTNLVDICDETKDRYYVRIGKYYGYVTKKYLA